MTQTQEINNDLFAAMPSQGMNRSADQVRSTCQVYIDSGRISDEGLESIIRLFNHGKAKGLSFDQTAALVDYSGATLSRLFAGKYEGALDKVVKQIDAYLELEREREKMKSDRFIENSIWNKVNALCSFALTRNAIVRLIGPSQIGKTYCLKEYMRRSNKQVCYVRIPAAPTMKLVVEAFARAVGVNSSIRVDDARQRVAKAVGRNTLLIIDELHELVMSAGKSTAMKCVEWMREIWDNSGCGMVLCGTKSLEDDLINDARMKGWLVQIDQRCQRVMNLPTKLPHEDILLAAESYGIAGSTACVDGILATIRMNRLTSCLALTASWCSGNNKSKAKHPKNWESFRTVYKAQFEEG
jgi:DNA transposition AAA+ family ATPase